MFDIICRFCKETITRDRYNLAVEGTRQDFPPNGEQQTFVEIPLEEVCPSCFDELIAGYKSVVFQLLKRKQGVEVEESPEEEEDLIPMEDFILRPHGAYFMTYYYECPTCERSTPFKLSGVMTNTDSKRVYKILFNFAICDYCQYVLKIALQKPKVQSKVRCSDCADFNKCHQKFTEESHTDLILCNDFKPNVEVDHTG